MDRRCAAGLLWLAAVPAAAQVSASMFLVQQASGTSENPASSGMHRIQGHAHAPYWMLMFRETAFITDIQQTGPRGADKFLSTKWFMASAHHPAGRSEFALRAMLSLDPATVTGRSASPIPSRR